MNLDNSKWRVLNSRNPGLGKTIAEYGGFVTNSLLPQIVAIDRMMMLLVRCGNGRFLCPAQDTAHFVKIITDSKQDYVRDVSLPADPR